MACKVDTDVGAAIQLNRDILHLYGLQTTLTGSPLAELVDPIDLMPERRKVCKNPAVTFEPFYFFFYGSLQDPSIVTRVAKQMYDSTDYKPVLKPGSIKGWEIMMWGMFPALVPKEGGEVHGKFWKCENIEEVFNLCYYETDAYRMEFCDIITEEGDVIKDGRIFVSTLESSELEEGSFDLERFMRGRA